MLFRSQKYHLEVHYKKGSEMYIADFLSREVLPPEKGTLDTPERQLFRLKEEQKFAKELADTDATEYLRVTEELLKQLQQQTGADEELQSQERVILKGYPESIV